MVFSSLLFLCAFLPVVLALYMICPAKYRNLLLTAVSLIFYAWGEPRYVLIMLFSTVFDYANGRLLEYFDGQKKLRAKKGILVLSVAGNLGILMFFKYADFLLASWNELTASHLGLLNLALPIGISFYTFQTMSYTIDVYRGKVKAQHNIIAFAMYVSMFPQLIAGPIVRYQSIENQLGKRVLTQERWVKGMQRFLIGLGKKVIFANQIGVLWDEIAQGNLTQLSMTGAWLGAFAYAFQIYFDFSGYSDMAIGLGHMFGFTLPENFYYPYESKNITEFWRRWHMTLSSWFREYVYFPLGGNRKGRGRQIFNLFVVWFLTGLWHGASWNFVLWGLYFFVILLLEKLFLLKEMKRWPVILQHLYGKLLIVAGWVIFALEDFGKIGDYLQIMFGMKNVLINQTALYELKEYGLFFAVLAAASTRFPIYLRDRLRRYMLREEREFALTKGKTVEFVTYSIYTVLILLISMGLLISGSYNPFLYFRF
jgi:alginate O-acetyltransferase complex protein AlgI